MPPLFSPFDDTATADQTPSFADKLKAADPDAAPLTAPAVPAEPTLTGKLSGVAPLRIAAPDYSKPLEELKAKSELGRPASAEETLKNFEALSDTAIKEADQKAQVDPEYQKQADILSNVKDQIANTKELIKDKAASASWLGVMENIGQSLVQLAAAKYGLAHGLNMSGVKSQPTDWNAVIKNTLDIMQDQLHELRGTKKETENLQEGITNRYQQAGARGVAEAQNASEKGKQFELDQANKIANIQMKQIDAVFDADKFNAIEAHKEATQALAQGGMNQVQLFKDIKNKQLGVLRSDLSQARKQEKALMEGRGEIEKLLDAKEAGTLTDKDITKMNANLSGKLEAAGIDRKQAIETTSHLWGLWKSQNENPDALRKLVSDKLQEVKSQNDQKEALEQALIGAESPAELKSMLESSGLGKAPAAAVPAAPRVLSSQDQQALTWAQANPADPRAAEIRKRLGQ